MTVLEILVLCVAAYLLGVARTEPRAEQRGFDEGYQRGRREGWEAAHKVGTSQGKVVRWPSQAK